ncbi:hypothetical protein [Uliginosibacterium gangwonense]|uniref:hypothetical protein n=1 Tax=Uliginosibacterium gangwonense TaxID=392736 RepID=UPI00037BBE49|nr:hypothetical protein [Uliginosibacterium gangwonense]
MVRTRVNMPLTEAELADLLALAQQEARSAGSMARLLFLRGLAAYQQQAQQPQVTRSSTATPGTDHD